MASSPEELLVMIRSAQSVRQDQWQVQIQAQVQMKADVYVKSAYLDAEAVERAMLNPCTSVENTVATLLDRYGPEATICVLPDGPMTISCVVQNT
jgi:nickel-dependent lactate racemase